MTKRFIATNDVEVRRKLIAEAETELQNTRDEHKDWASTYTKMMTKLLDKGNDFVDSEIERTLKLSDGLVSDRKKIRLKERINILNTFKSHGETKSRKDEL